jgi:hypothetical protein
LDKSQARSVTTPKALFQVTPGLVNVPGDTGHRDRRGDDHVGKLGEQVVTRAAGSLPP